MDHSAVSLVALLSLTATSLPSEIARELGLGLRGRVELRAMLCDYIYGIRPGSRQSLLHGAQEAELDRCRTQLVKELVRAIERVAARAECRWQDGLRHLAAEMTNCLGGCTQHGMLEEWMVVSRVAGTSEIDFLQVCQ